MSLYDENSTVLATQKDVWIDFSQNELSPELKIYLVSFKQVTSDDADKINVAQKEEVLRKLSDTIAATSRCFREDEKDFLFFYFKKAFEQGFDALKIGLDDALLAKLVATKEDDDKSFDKQDILSRHEEILNLMLQLDTRYGFFEETASRLIGYDTTYINALIKRCISLIKNEKISKGAVFAKNLLWLGRTNAAIEILVSLAEIGQATEMTAFAGLLAVALKDNEQILFNIFKLNLMRQKEKSHGQNFMVLRNYVTKCYLQAVRSFLETQKFDCAAVLLKELFFLRFIDADSPCLREFAELGNVLLAKNFVGAGFLPDVAKKIGLDVVEENGKKFLGLGGNSAVFELRMMQTLEGIDEAAFVLPKEVLTGSKQTSSALKKPTVTANPAQSEKEKAEIKSVEQIPEPDIVIEDESDIVVENEPTTETKEGMGISPLDELLLHHERKSSDETQTSLREDNVSVEDDTVSDIPKEFEKNKANINSILNINSKEIDEQLEKIKNVTSLAVQKAGETASKLKQRVADSNITASSSVDKIRALAEKVPFFKKKA